MLWNRSKRFQFVSIPSLNTILWGNDQSSTNLRRISAIQWQPLSRYIQIFPACGLQMSSPVEFRRNWDEWREVNSCHWWWLLLQYKLHAVCISWCAIFRTTKQIRVHFTAVKWNGGSRIAVASLRSIYAIVMDSALAGVHTGVASRPEIPGSSVPVVPPVIVNVVKL